MAQWFLGLFYYFRAEMRALPRDRRTSSSIVRTGWTIRCWRAKRRVRTASRSWTWASSAAAVDQCDRVAVVVRDSGRSSDEGVCRTGSRGHERMLCGSGPVGAGVSRPSHGPHRPRARAGQSALTSRDPGDRDVLHGAPASASWRGSRGARSRGERDRPRRRLWVIRVGGARPHHSRLGARRAG